MRLYSITDIADALGVQRATVSQWLHRGQIPEPSQRVGGRAVWTAEAIEPWIRKKRKA